MKLGRIQTPSSVLEGFYLNGMVQKVWFGVIYTDSDTEKDDLTIGLQ